jgi:hypothetical protein
MGGGDLNLKKSWNPQLIKNQSKVYDAQISAVAERKKVEQVRREREEEREKEQLDRLAEEAGGTKRQNRVDWMYSGASSGTLGTTEEQEAFLLGKRRVDTILKKEIEHQRERTSTAVVEHDPTRDVTAKVALDPLLMIERQKKEAMEKAAAIEAKAREREERKREKHRKRDRSRDRSRDRHSRSKRSPSPRRHRHHSSEPRHRSSHRSNRSRSPDRRRSYRSRTPERKSSHRSSDKHQNSHHRSSDNYSHRNSHRSQKPLGLSEEERQARLAAMQNDASHMEDDRSKRLAELERQDADEREREDKKRDRGVNFKSSLYTQTENVGLEARLKNTRKDQISA